MKLLVRLLSISSGLLIAIFYSSKVELPVYSQTSPDGNIKLTFNIDTKGIPFYTINYLKDTLIYKSQLGIDFTDTRSLKDNFELIDVEYKTINSSYKPLYGENEEIDQSHNQITIYLKEKYRNGKDLTLQFKIFNDGVGFRYLFPTQKKFKTFRIKEEQTEFNIKRNAYAWWIPANYVSDEMLYNASPLNKVDSIIKGKFIKGANEFYMKNDASTIVGFNTPLTLYSQKGYYLAFHEAEQLDYADTKIILQKKNGSYKLKTFLTPSSSEPYKVMGKGEYKTPWRAIIIAKSPSQLAESNLIFNLNQTPDKRIKYEEWAKPIKYVGIWWGYHIGKYGWDYVTDKPHGATTENAKAYIDFAAQNGFDAVLVEGWCDYLSDSVAKSLKLKNYKDIPHKLRNYTQPFPDYNLEEVAAYAKSKKTQLIAHNETMGMTQNYEAQLEKNFQYYQSLGIHYVKTGYAWYIENGKYYHQEQFNIQHYTKVMQMAAKYQINLIVHEGNKDTGLRKQYPNLMTRESVRGNEYNAWDKAMGNPPEHETILPFTRQLAGPIDFTPGIFDITFDKYKELQRVNTTKAKQLALYVVLYSPIVMAADLIENYEKDSAFQFIKSVPVNWQKTKVLKAEIGNYVVTARKNGENWYVGGITDENSRELKVNFSFLDSKKKYRATFYTDAESTSLDQNPTKVKIFNQEIDNKAEILIKLAQSGGFAIKIEAL